MNEEHSGEFPLRSGRRLKGHGIHACDLGQKALELEQEPEKPLGEFLGKKRMGRGKSRQTGLLVIDLRIVLHCAGAQGIGARVHTEVPGGEPGKVANHIHFAEIRKIRARGREALFQRGELHIARGKRETAPSGLAFFPEKRLIEDEPGRT
jgi:hypothetical protein